MKKLILCGLVLLLAGGMVFAAGGGQTRSDTGTIKIGMIFPFSGPNAA